MNDPVEQYVSETIHEVFMNKLPAFIAVARHLISKGTTREKLLEIIKSKNPAPDMYRMMETEVDYLIAEAKNEA